MWIVFKCLLLLLYCIEYPFLLIFMESFDRSISTTEPPLTNLTDEVSWDLLISSVSSSLYYLRTVMETVFLPSREHFWMSKIPWLCMRQNTVGLIKRLPVPYLRNWHRVLPIFFSKIYHLCTCNTSAGGLNREVWF